MEKQFKSMEEFGIFVSLSPPVWYLGYILIFYLSIRAIEGEGNWVDHGGIFTGNLESWFPRNLGASNKSLLKLTHFVAKKLCFMLLVIT